ncbi:Hpt domain-containing protein [Parvularcula marina]|nr:Hpt domain-containing protein [Parvularcula marina]
MMSVVTASVIDESQIGGLAEAAGIEGVKMILDAFWTSTDELCEQLNAALAADDKPGLIRIGHTLKGSSANIGAALMADRAKEIELAAKEGELERARDGIARFLSDIADTRAAIEEILNRYG